MKKEEKRKKESEQEAFFKSVYQIVRDIPEGSVSTYGQIAFLMGKPDNPRLVGKALRLAPSDRGLPCHRVVNAAGRCVPGWEEQKQLLISEGVGFKRNGCVDIITYLWKLF